MSDPFAIQGPALIQFSGGRSSGYMLHEIIRAHGGALPDDILVTFANTGKEMPQTLDFVRDCGERWGCEIVWLEYAHHDEPKHRWRRVTYETASREGEPFAAMLATRPMLPSPVIRFCTLELKVTLIHRWAKTVGMGKADRVIGFRADEPHRLAKARGRETSGGDPWLVVAPMVTAGTTKADVMAFWDKQNFDLRLPNVNGKTAMGNCDLCFLKSAAQISAIMRDHPDLATWWIEQEANAAATASTWQAGRFRKDRPSYAEMLRAVQNQSGFDFGDADALNDCFCGEPG